MNRRQLTLLIVLGAALGVLAWLAYQKQQSPYQESTRRMGEKLIKDFPLNDVARITIKQANAELNLVKKEDLWTVKERGNYPANFSTLSEFLRKVWELKVTQPVKTTAARLARLELVEPGKGLGTLVEFKDDKGKLINSLLLGAKHTKESSGDSPFGGGSWPDGRYVMVGNDLKSVAMVSDPFSNVEPKPEEWLNKDWFKVEKLKSISVVSTNATNNWKLARETESGEWKLADAKAGEQLDTGKSSGVTTALSYPSFSDIATNSEPAATGLDKALAATLETFDDFTYTAKVGGKAGGEDNYYFQIAVAAKIPKERTPGKDEKPEDKAKLDKEFKDKVSKLEERLKNEKAFEKWTYVVSKWTVDPLLKERKDLLAEKKEEPKKEEPKKEETKKEEPKKDEGQKTGPKKDETKKEEPKPANKTESK